MKVAEQIEILERIARDEQTNPTARVTAIRALRQVEQDHESDELAGRTRAPDHRQARWLRRGGGGGRRTVRSSATSGCGRSGPAENSLSWRGARPPSASKGDYCPPVCPLFSYPSCVSVDCWGYRG